MPADFQNNGDAQQAGWQRTKGAGPGGQGFQTTYDIHLSQDRQAGHALRITAISYASGGNADAQALAALNGWRRMRYGADSGSGSKGPRSGQALVPDST